MSIILFEKARDYVQNTKSGVSLLAEATGLNRSQLSTYLNNAYGTGEKPVSDVVVGNIENELMKFFGEDIQSGADSEPGAEDIQSGDVPELLFTGDLENIFYVCKTCQDKRGLGIITGKPGSGKTYSLKHYARKPKAVYVECNEMMRMNEFIGAIRQAFGLHDSFTTAAEGVKEICDFCNHNPGYLLLIDEADKTLSKYTQKKMEVIRTMYDNATVGIVLCGEPNLEKNINKYVGRMADRMDWAHRMQGLTASEAAEYISGFAFAEDVKQKLIARGCNDMNGSFRRLNRIIENIKSTYCGKTQISSEMFNDVARIML